MVDGPADDTTIRPLSPDMRNVQISNDEIGRLFSFMQLGTGETEAVMGISGSSRETARGFLGRQENALTRLAMEARLAEEGFIEPLANLFRQLDRQYLTRPHQMKILGSMATINPITGLPYPAEPVTIEDDDLQPDYRARAVGATQMLGKSVRQQNLMALLQVMSSNPALMQLVNWANFAREAFILFDFNNVNELLVNQVPMVNQMAEQAGVAPETVAQGAEMLGQLDPNILAGLSNNQTAGSLSPMGTR